MDSWQSAYWLYKVEQVLAGPLPRSDTKLSANCEWEGANQLTSVVSSGDIIHCRDTKDVTVVHAPSGQRLWPH